MRIYIPALDIDLPAARGDSLYRVLAAAALLDAPCGGQGRCGQCGVRFLGAPPPAAAREQSLFTEERLQAGWRLSCLHSLEEDVEIELPLHGNVVAEGAFWVGAEPPPSVEEAEGLGLALDIGTTTLAAVLLERRSGRLLASAACLNSQKAYGQDVISRICHAANAQGLQELQNAVLEDIRQLLNELYRKTEARSQMTEDRINRGGRCKPLKKSHEPGAITNRPYKATAYVGAKRIRPQVGQTFSAVSTHCAPLQGSCQPEDITFAAVAANPTMIHLLAGVDPAPLGRAPYQLALSGPVELSARQLALPLGEGTSIYCLPAAAAYLGGDIVGGLLALEMDFPGPTRLLLDIGTNGEMVLSHQGRLWGCSTAAGPALEGMNISCGMRAATGAIESVEIEAGRVLCRTIDDCPPLGLAGSGLISAVSALLRAGLLDKTGRLLMRAPVTEAQGHRQLPLNVELGLALTQADIRQMQLAKAAIRSGLETLLIASACPAEAVEQVIVAGAFGAHLKAEDLLTTGIIPPELAGKIHYVGVAALAGARLALLSAEARMRAQRLAVQINYIELAGLSDYQQRFIQAMKF